MYTSGGNWLENIVSREYLQDNLTFVSLYIAVFENFKDYVVSQVKCFLCDEEVVDGKLHYRKSNHYKKEILYRRVGNKGQHNATLASFLWLLEHEAITQEDYDQFIKIKAVRNKYAHQLSEVILNGVEAHEVDKFLSMLNLYKKISKWWFIQIEAPIMGYDVDENADIQSSSNLLFDMILEVLYNGKSEEFMHLIQEKDKA